MSLTQRCWRNSVWDQDIYTHPQDVKFCQQIPAQTWLYETKGRLLAPVSMFLRKTKYWGCKVVTVSSRVVLEAHTDIITHTWIEIIPKFRQLYLSDYTRVVFTCNEWNWFPPRNGFFWNVWTHSEKICSHYMPVARKTTKDNSRVHSCISRKLNNCFSWLCLSGPTQCFKCAFVANFAQCTQKLSVACGQEWD